MLADVGCRLVIVGHSERRHGHGEDDRLVRAKAAAGHAAGLLVVLCVGETEAERDAGAAIAVLDRQLEGSLPDGASAENLVVAYEPVWAIGTGRTPSVDDIAAVHAHLRARLRALVRGRRRRCGCSMAARSSPPMPARSWPSPTSTASWSAAPVSTPISSMPYTAQAKGRGVTAGASNPVSSCR